MKISWDSIHLDETEGCGNPGILFKGPAHELLFTGTHPGLWQKDGDLGGSRVTQEDTELCGFWQRAGGTATKFPVLSPSPSLSKNAIFLGLSTPSKCHGLGELY